MGIRSIALTVVLLATACVERHHPENFSGGAVHGPALKLQTEDCRGCHGDDLSGGTSEVGCDGCHSGPSPTAWRTNCTFCHGGMEDTTGAPPRNIHGTDLVGPFPAHSKHVAGSSLANAYDCTQCHQKAIDVLSPGHVFDNTPGEAENDYGGGLSPQASFDKATATCTNTYCHGSGRADDGMISARAPALSCAGCHPTQESGAAGWGNMSGPHSLHMGLADVSCADCHGGTTTNGTTIASKLLHINGQRDVMITAPGGLQFDQKTQACTGSCHGFDHVGAPWAGVGAGGKYHPAGFAAGSVHGPEMELQRQDCRGCHGATLTGGSSTGLKGPSCDSCHSVQQPTAWRTNCTFCHGGGGDTSGAPPRDLGSSNTNTAQSFIAHRKHVNTTKMTPIDCTTCHGVKPTDVLSIGHAFDATKNGDAEVMLTMLGAGGTYSAGTCTNLYCHGNGRTNGSFTDGLTATCISCHGGAANNKANLSGNHGDEHKSYACAECHMGTVATGSTVISTPALHINKQKDVVFSQGGTYDGATKTCTNIACHGSERW